MAELVQLHAERSLSELEHLKQVKLFSDSEIKAVRRMRTKFEYKVAGANKTKENYLKYIQYEISLLNLVKVRRQKQGLPFKKKEIDSQIGKKINNLFKLVIKRFPEDTQLWLSHREFLKKMNWHENMSGMLIRMLQIHNKNPDMWVTVAKWELEDNKACDTARQVLQRALRFHPESQHIWREYFRMELIYADQVRKRREILGMAKMEDDTNDEILEGKIALVAVKESLKTIQDVNFALSLIPICEEFDFAQMHKEWILTFVKENFQHKEETWNALARCCVNQSRNEKGFKEAIYQAFSVFEEGITLIQSEKSWTYYLQFILDEIKAARSVKTAAKLTRKILELFQKAFDNKLLSQDMILEWIRLLHSLGDKTAARNLAVKAKSLFPNNAKILECCLTIHANSETDKSFFLMMLRNAVSNVTDEEALPLWKLAIDFILSGRNNIITELFEFGLTQGPIVCNFIKVEYLKYSIMTKSEEDTQLLYQRLSLSQPLTEKLFLTMAEHETFQMNVDSNKVRRCFENSLIHFGLTGIDTWINYAKFELENPNGQPSKVGSIYSRAIKTLNSELCDKFIEKYTLLNK